MDRVVVDLLNSALEHPDPFETTLGAARWWAKAGSRLQLRVEVHGKPCFDSHLAAALRALRTSVAAATRAGSAHVRFAGTGADAVLFPIAHACAAFLGGPQSARLRRCALPVCARYFLDATKNRGRRWCSLRCMERARAPRRRKIGA